MNVLTPQQRNSVVTLLQNKVSQHQIKRKTGIDRKTIRKLTQELSAALVGASNSSTPATGSGKSTAVGTAGARALGV